MPDKSAFDSIKPGDTGLMKRRSAERMCKPADITLNPNQVKWNRKNFAKDLERNNQTTPMGTSVIRQMRDEASY